MLLLCQPLAAAQSPTPLAITHVNVIDATGAQLRRDVTVLIRDGRIASLGPAGAALPQDAVILDARGKYVIPGLWDMHVHLSWSGGSALLALIANGVTSVRDVGGSLTQLDDWRARIHFGILAGPRILRCGPILNGKKFNQYQMVPGTPEETRGVVRALKEVGADCIKVHRRMERNAYLAAIDEAKKLGIPLVGHIPMTVTPEEASEAGQATIEHVATLFEGTFSAALANEHEIAGAIRRFRVDGAGQLFARLVKNHTVFDPTLAPYQPLDPSAPPDPNSRYVARSQLEEWKQKVPSLSAAEFEEAKQTFAEFKEIVRQAHRAGVTIVTGTDLAGPRVPGFPLHDELAMLVECGLTPIQALQAATITSARTVGKGNDFGAVEPGKVADLVVLDANPLDDIHNTRRIFAVVFGGKLLRRGDLDALLQQAAVMASRN